jgi:predicted phage baseplate assembly protein
MDPVPVTSAMARVGSNGGEPTPVFARFRPRLREAPLTQAAPYLDVLPSSPGGRQERIAPAAAAMRWTTRDPLPAISLSDGASGARWKPRRDLLGSGPFVTEFVAEVEADGRAYLRFGDDRFGMRPTPGTRFTATYRVGNGTRGNVGAEALGHVVSDDERIVGVRNPMPARGGMEPESIEHARQSAPSAFREQERAVTPEDYARIVERHPEVQRAAATVRWTGSWRTVFLTVDRLGGLAVDAGFEEEMRLYLEKYRMAGHDVEIDGPRFVFLEVEMLVCVQPEYFRGDVKSVLLDVFGDRTLPDGRRGVFHPDNFTFGQPVYLSPLYAAAQAVEGVASVEISKLQRLRRESRQALDDGFLSVGPLEVARLDNDPNFPERGVFRLTVEGGK